VSWQGGVLYFILGIRSVNERLSFQVLFDLGKLQSQLPQPTLVDKQLVVPGVEMRDKRDAVRVKLLVDKLHNVLIEISLPRCLWFRRHPVIGSDDNHNPVGAGFLFQRLQDARQLAILFG
jgi:hypothetical protein